MTGALLILALITLQRCGELLLARHNTRRLLERGAVEIAPGHYPLIIAVHAFWILGLWCFGWHATVGMGWLLLFALLQLLRLWVIATLGARWTTRIIIVPGLASVRTGPYRWINHPNYAVVAAEIAVLPLVFGLPWFALMFSALNGAVLAVRICAENRAMTEAMYAPTA